MTHGIINHHCLNRPYIELYAKMGSCSIVSSGIYFRCGKGGMTANESVFAMAGYSSFITPVINVQKPKPDRLVFVMQ